VIVYGVLNAGPTNSHRDDGGVFWLDGAADLTLRNLALVGCSRDYHESDDDEEDITTEACDSGIAAFQGARVDVANCWFSHFGRMMVRAGSGAHVRLSDCTLNRSYFGVAVDDAGTTMVVQRCLFQGKNCYGGLANSGGRLDVRDCAIRGSNMACLNVQQAGSRLRVQSTSFSNLPRVVVLASGTLALPKTELGDDELDELFPALDEDESEDEDLRAVMDEDQIEAGFDDDPLEWTTNHWVSITAEGWQT